MGWSYSGDPSSSSRDEVRFLIGDTNPDAQQLQDGEIDYILVVHPKRTGYANYVAAAMAARTIASRYTEAIDKSVGRLSIKLGDRRDRYSKLADELELMARTGQGQVVGAPILGGGGRTYLGEREWFDGHSP